MSGSFKIKKHRRKKIKGLCEVSGREVSAYDLAAGKAIELQGRYVFTRYVKLQGSYVSTND